MWAAPIVAVVALLASGRVGTVRAGVAGMALAALVALTAAPHRLGPPAAAAAAVRGAWLGWLAVMVILGGLFFHRVVEQLGADRAAGAAVAAEHTRRRALFAACFLIGPFVESATGFGVGYVAALAIIGRLGLPPARSLVLGLFSQMLVPWGGLAVGTDIGAHLAGVTPDELGLRSALLTLPLLAVWLGAFWWLAGPAAAGERWAEAGWTAALGAALVGVSAVTDADVAVVASLGPLIALRFLLVDRPPPGGRAAALAVALPYAALTLVLVCVHVVGPLRDSAAVRLALRPPVGGAVGWYPLLHPFLWLLGVAAATALARGRGGLIAGSARYALARGWRAAVATIAFLVMAQLVAEAGVAAALAAGFARAVGPLAAIAASPLFPALAGMLTSSNSASNGLLMPTQGALGAAAGVSVVWLAAIQNTTGSALTMLSPVRIGLGCALLERPDLVRTTYRLAWPLGALATLTMIGAALLLALRR